MRKEVITGVGRAVAISGFVIAIVVCLVNFVAPRVVVQIPPAPQVTLPAPIDPTIMAVVRISDLEVTNKIQMINSSGPTIRAATGNPNGAVTAPLGSIQLRTDASAIYTNTDGATSWIILSVGGLSGSGTANVIPKFTGASTIGNSLVGDDGTTFTINTNKFRVTEASGNTVIAGTTTSTGKVLLDDSNGDATYTLATDDGTPAGVIVTGYLKATSDFSVNTNKFTVTASNGNTLVAGTLTSTGRVSLDDSNGDATYTLATVVGPPAGVVVTGTLSATSDFSVNTNKFTVTASSGNTLVAGTLTVSPLTAGSVLFAGTAGLVSQDNTNFFWNNTTKSLTVTSPNATAIGAKSNDTVSGTMFITNTNVSGPSDFYATDNAGTSKISFGYGNATYGDSARATRGYVWRNTSVDFVFARTGLVDGMLFSTGNFNLGATTTDPSVKLRVEGSTTMGSTGSTTDRHTANGGLDAFESVGTTFASIDSAANSNLASYDTTALAAGVGGGILFLGKYTGGFYVGAAGIKAMKLNGTDGNYGFDLVLGARANGSGSITEALRLFGANNGANIVGDFSVNTNKFTVTASNGNTLVAGTATLNGLISLGAHERVTGTALGNGDLSSCGGGTPTAVGTDVAGRITEGTTATGCVLTFKSTWTSAPFCVCSSETNVAGTPVTVSCVATATTLTFTNASASADVMIFRCTGQSGAT